MLGQEIGAALTEILTDTRFTTSVREAACASLGKIGFQPALEPLLALVRAAPETGTDEAVPLIADQQRLARAAAFDGIIGINPQVLLHEPGQLAGLALAQYAITTGRLVYEDCVSEI